MDSTVHTAGRLADSLKAIQPELAKAAAALADDKTTISDMHKAVESVVDRFDSLDPRLDAKVGVGRMNHHYFGDRLHGRDILVFTASIAATIGTYLALKDVYQPSSGFGGPVFHPAAIPGILTIALFGDGGAIRGAPIQTAAQVVLQKAEELAGMAESEPAVDAIAADTAAAPQN